MTDINFGELLRKNIQEKKPGNGDHLEKLRRNKLKNFFDEIKERIARDVGKGLTSLTYRIPGYYAINGIQFIGTMNITIGTHRYHDMYSDFAKWLFTHGLRAEFEHKITEHNELTNMKLVPNNRPFSMTSTPGIQNEDRVAKVVRLQEMKQMGLFAGKGKPTDAAVRKYHALRQQFGK